MSCFQCIAF